MIFLFFISLAFADTRIVSLNPTITEILFEMELGNNIVGTTTFSNYPEDAKKIKTVGSYAKPNLELIIELKPTHVLAFKEGDSEIATSLKKAKMPLHTFDSRSLEDYQKLIIGLGRLFSKAAASNKMMENWRDNWSKLNNFSINKTALIQVDHNPLFIAGSDTFISESFEKCGITNIFRTVKGYKSLPLESLKANRPDIVLFVGNIQIPEVKRINEIADFWKNNPLSKGAPVMMGDADILSRLGPRLPIGVLTFCKQIQSTL